MEIVTIRKRKCELCGKEFELNPRTGIKWALKTGRGRFCSDECSRTASRGKRRSRKTEFSSGKTAGEFHPRWKGGVETTRWGYTRKYAPTHPKVHQGKVFEHRLVVEKVLGRFLTDQEVVHHINGNKKDNRFENLMLFANQSEHLKFERGGGGIGTACIGAGWVGKAMKRLFPSAYVYDIPIGLGNSKELVNKADVAFICVPTPAIGEGKLDTSIVEEVIDWCRCPLLIIRSTINPGDCDRWKARFKKKIVFIPEYLGETVSHPMFDPKTRDFLIIGGEPADRRKAIDLFATVYNANINIRQVSLYEAEVIKLSENRAIAFKVAECQELYDACEKAGVDYYTVREAVYSDDPRFNLWWTFIYPNKRGFNSKCIPKDVYAWAAWAESVNSNTDIVRALLERNKKWISQS